MPAFRASSSSRALLASSLVLYFIEEDAMVAAVARVVIILRWPRVLMCTLLLRHHRKDLESRIVTAADIL
jgi:hypothetical protein